MPSSEHILLNHEKAYELSREVVQLPSDDHFQGLEQIYGVGTCFTTQNAVVRAHIPLSCGLRYKEAMEVYEYKRREWVRLEVERKERLAVQCHKSRLDHLHIDTLAGLKT